MAQELVHRGPDDAGIWFDAKSGVAIAHRRLSVVDLSNAGHQPMQSASGRWVLAYNGEIYNHLNLRDRLEEECVSPNWRGHSDTETLLACIDAWGIDATLERCVGMFAIALWDSAEQTIVLARDRMGEKPLYYGWQNKTFLFASELKALRVHPDFTAVIDRNSLSLLLRHNCIPAPYSIYEKIHKLRPGYVLRVPLSGQSVSRELSEKQYWSFNNTVEDGLRNPFSGSVSEAVDALECELSNSIGGQMLSDVPLGAFLSGGIDSSTVVALMQAQSNRPVKTFTVGLAENDFDEAAYAKAVARHLGTEHTELYISPDDALAVIPSLPATFCEPFGDSSQIPTFLISKLAREQVTVALSGDGGDELFGGYNRYLMARTVWNKSQRLPGAARRTAACFLRTLSPKSWDKLFDGIRPLLPNHLRLSNPGYKAHKLADVLGISERHEYYYRLSSHWTDTSSIVIGGEEPATLSTRPEAWPRTNCFEHWMMAMDAQTYMPDDILVKVDRAAMACSLETRVPMLDHRVVELAWRMPIDFKIRDGQGKWLLRQVLYRHVPKELIERPKMGFGIPIGSWLRGPLRDWAEDLLNEQRLKTEGYFRHAPIRAMWMEHINGKGNWQYHLWTILMFQAWLAESSIFSQPSTDVAR